MRRKLKAVRIKIRIDNKYICNLICLAQERKMGISVTGGVKVPRGKFSVSTSAAAATNGTLWSWGKNNVGQVGDGTIVYRSSPVQVGGLTDWADISTGGSNAGTHSFAINTTGELWGWGEANAGRLGDGTTIDKSSPIQIGSLTTWTSSAASNGHSHALQSDGTLWAWGNNFLGRLGTNNAISPSSPVQVGALSDWSVLTSGNHHSLVIKTNGELWAFGSAAFGQVG
ncbi:hypothetical protein LCGC14_3015380, partial [marine sediment metagenome]